MRSHNEPLIRDGIRFTPSGRPLSCFIANPKASILDSFTNTDSLTSADFAEIPIFKNGRLVFHLFRHEEEEQMRGYSAFALGIALFRNLTDCLNNELISQTLASSFFVEQYEAGARLLQKSHAT